MPVTRNFRKVRSFGVYRKWKFWSVGDYVIGKFDRVKMEEEIKKDGSKKVKRTILVEVEETNFKSNGFIDPKGKAKDCGNLKAGTLLALNDNANLINALRDAQVKAGDIVKITFQGTYIIKTGDYAGSTGNNVELEVAEYADMMDDESGEEEDHPALDV